MIHFSLFFLETTSTLNLLVLKYEVSLNKKQNKFDDFKKDSNGVQTHNVTSAVMDTVIN